MLYNYKLSDVITRIRLVNRCNLVDMANERGKRKMDYLVESRIVSVIGDGFRQTYDQIAGQVPCHPYTAQKYIRRLTARGVLSREGSGKRGSFCYRVNKAKAAELGYI